MFRSFTFKLVAIGLLAILLLVPLALIESLVAERASRRDEAVRSVAEALAGRQHVVPPAIAWPLREEWDETTAGDNGSPRTVRRSERRVWLWTPEDAELAFAVDVREDHRRGLHRVRTFRAVARIRARFGAAARPVAPRHPGGRITWGTPLLTIGVADVRGLVSAPRLQVDGQPLRLARGSQLAGAPNGLHAELPGSDRSTAPVVELEFELVGLERLAVLPIAGTTRVQMSSPWPHPSFGGRHLPATRRVGAEGFEAAWSIDALASGAQAELVQAAGGPDGPGTRLAETVEVAFVDPVNVYLLAERATKHGVLFVAIAFALLLLREALGAAPLHPVQYGLVGLALAVFFLLLLSLSEHLPFALAYLVAACACTALLAAYAAGAIGRWRDGARVAAVAAVLYAAVYGVLVDEKNALLTGSLLVFAVLATLMLATRRVDWSRAGAPAALRA